MIKNINQRYDILRRELNHSMKHDEKLFWWLLADPTEKIVNIFLTSNKFLIKIVFDICKSQQSYGRIFGIVNEFLIFGK